MMDVHERIRVKIQDFLQHQPIVSLVSGGAGEVANRCIKAGVVPFVRQDEYRYFLMKPVAKRPELGAPAFQLCKGTRMQQVAGVWEDMHDNDIGAHPVESLVSTALREGIEELGLKLDAMRQVIDVGPYDFSSSITGRSRQMWLFAVEMITVDDVLPMADVAPTTADRSWLTLPEFMVAGRADHRYILEDIAARLKAQYA